MTDKLSFLSTIPPFDRLDAKELNRVVGILSHESFNTGRVIINRWQGPGYLYILIKGLVEEQDADGSVAHYSSQDTFDARSLIEGRSAHRFIAVKACDCYRLPAQPFLALLREHKALHDYYYQDLARKLDALAALQQQREVASFMLARIGDGQLHEPVFVAPETSIREATATMKSSGSSALLVKHTAQVGIFTSRDVREKAVLAGMPESTPIGSIASYALITLDKDEFLFKALVVMTKHAIRHVVITQGDDIIGVLEQIDLLNYLSHHSYLTANQIDNAHSLEDLKQAGDSIPRVIKSLHDRGTKPRYIAKLVNDLNQRLFHRLYQQIAPQTERDTACLIVMGSEGRGEQLLRTDQDNALILHEDQHCRGLQQLTAEFTDALIKLGYPPCPGNVMVSNPFWAKSLQAYKTELFRWIHQPDEDAYMNLAIFYDARAVAGDKTLLDDLKTHFFHLLQDNQVTIQHFAKAVLAFETPLGWFNRFIVEKKGAHKGRLDIKKAGIFPIVHGIRSLALQSQITESNTINRIQILSSKGLLEERFTADLIEAFEFMSMLRLREQLSRWDQGDNWDNYVDPGRLNKLERGLLKDSFRVVKELKTFITHHFKLELVS